MQVGHFKTGLFLNFGNRAENINTRKLRIIRFPNRNRRSPETVAGNRPVAGAFQPFAEAAVFNMLRHPVNLLVVFNHIVAEIGYFNKPAGHRFVNQRGVGTPAERIRVGILLFFNQKAFFFQQLHNRFVGFKNLFALIVGNFGGKFTGFVNRTDNREILIISAAGLKVVLAEARGNMDNAGTVFGGDEGSAQHFKSALVFQLFEIRKHRLIAHTDQIFAFQRPRLRGVFKLFFIAAEQSLSQNIFLAVFFHDRIVDVLTDRQHQV